MPVAAPRVPGFLLGWGHPGRWLRVGGDLCQAVGHSLDMFGHAITIDSQITYRRKLKHNCELLTPGDTTNHVLRPKLCLFSSDGKALLIITLSKKYWHSKTKTRTNVTKHCLTVYGNWQSTSNVPKSALEYFNYVQNGSREVDYFDFANTLFDVRINKSPKYQLVVV